MVLLPYLTNFFIRQKIEGLNPFVTLHLATKVSRYSANPKHREIEVGISLKLQKLFPYSNSETLDSVTASELD